MAKTRTPAQAINILRKSLPKLDDSSFAVFAADEALKQVWKDHTWPDSLVELPPFYFTPNEPDTDASEGFKPNDFLGLLEAQIRVVDGQMWPLKITNYLPKSSHTGRPTSITYNKENDIFRCHPAPSESWGAPWAQVECVYKKESTAITMNNLNTALPFDDQYFLAYQDALRYIYFRILSDQRAGQVQFSNGRAFYTGQLAIYKEALNSAIVSDNMLSGPRQITPTEGLSLG